MLRRTTTLIAAAAQIAAVSLLGASTVDAADVPFACGPGFYQVISGQLAALDPASALYQPVGPDYSNYNAMGYRVADNFLYAIQGSNVVRIDAAGTLTTVGSVPIVPGSYTGDFGDDGLLHVSRGGTDWFAVDVEALTATPISTFNTNVGVADIANISGVFYGVSNTGVLWKFDPATGVASNGGQVAGIPTSGTVFGAAWATAGGNLYVGRNSGEIYQVTGYSTGSPVATQVGSSPNTSSNDGASCALAAPPAGIADVDGPTPEVPPTTPEAIAAAEAYESTYVDPQFAAPDAGVGTGAACDPTLDEDRLPRDQMQLLAFESETALYANSFDADANGMYVSSGSWIVENGTYRQQNTCGFDYTALLPDYMVDSFDLDVRFHSPTGANQGGVLFNQSSVHTRSGAILVDLADDGATLRWGRYDDAGYYENIGWDLIPAPAVGEQVWFHIEVRGDQYTIFHNGNEVVTAQTDAPGGMVGLVATQSDVAFDEVILTAVPSV